MNDRSEEKSAKQAGRASSAAERPQEESPGSATGESGGREPDASSGTDDGGRVEELTAELETLRDRYLRTVAEYENFRRRTERERAEAGVRAQAHVVEKLLEPLDDLQRVAHFRAEKTSVEALLEGVQMVERKLQRVLESAGLEIIDAHGQPFDPSLHEALMTAPASTREEDESVGEVLQQGYQFKGILLRPARVQVRKYGG